MQPLPDGKPHTFRVEGSQFTLDGKPFRVISGEMHYPRIPREYWRARLKMARAMGLNAITTYVFWNEHELTPGSYGLFWQQRRRRIYSRSAAGGTVGSSCGPGRMCARSGEFGGYPAWLLKDPTTVIRSSDPKFLEPATRWIKRLGQELAPLQAGNGGPIVLVQVENEYGSFGKRPRLYGSEPEGAGGRGVHQGAALHRGWARRDCERLAAGFAGGHQLRRQPSGRSAERFRDAEEDSGRTACCSTRSSGQAGSITGAASTRTTSTETQAGEFAVGTGAGRVGIYIYVSRRDRF